MNTRRALSHSALEQSADQFRERYASGVAGRLDIEPIIEFNLGVEITPQDGLLRDAGFYAFLASTGDNIVVDTATQTNWALEDYQQLLAHETAHLVLHKPLLPKQLLTSQDAFVRFHDSFPRELQMQVEYEARYWGRAVRMPATETAVVFNAAVEAAKDSFRDIRRGGAKLWIEGTVADHFGVGADHAETRLQDLKVWGPLWRSERGRTITAFPSI